jgi:hypothetical protein
MHEICHQKQLVNLRVGLSDSKRVLWIKMTTLCLLTAKAKFHQKEFFNLNLAFLRKTVNTPLCLSFVVEPN